MKSITPRIIKFRVWDGEKMIYPSIVGLPPYENFAWEHSRSYLHNCQYWDGEDGFVLEPTLMQFTGLHDKDGKEIYGDDIIYIPAGNPYDVVEGNHKVVWGLSGWYIEPLEGFRYADVDDSDLALYNFAQSAKVNGNIHQPELIEGDSTTLK